MHLITHTTGPTSRKSLLTTLVLLIGLGVAWQPAGAAPSQPVNPPCTPLSGTFVFTLFQFDSATTAHGEVEVWAGGAVVAYGTAQYFNIEPKGKGVIQMNGQHMLTFLDGSTLVTSDEILLQSDNQNPYFMRANSRLYIVGGTGEYAGATGLLHTHGGFDVGTLEGGIDFKGQVCVP